MGRSLRNTVLYFSKVPSHIYKELILIKSSDLESLGDLGSSFEFCRVTDAEKTDRVLNKILV